MALAHMHYRSYLAKGLPNRRARQTERVRLFTAERSATFADILIRSSRNPVQGAYILEVNSLPFVFGCDVHFIVAGRVLGSA